jgi:hypothetical protein
MEKYQQQQQQQAEQQQQVQEQLTRAQIELIVSKTIHEVMSAKERGTRSVANLGLEDERSSEAIQNRTQAVLDQVRAVKELDEIDVRTAKEELALAAILREQNRLEEEKLKADNVTISAQVAGGPPPGAVNPNQQEVPNAGL